MPTTNLKIGYNSRGPHVASTANYTQMDTVTSVVGGATNLYEVISPAYPGTVPVGTLVTNTTYFRLLVAGATGPTGATGGAGSNGTNGTAGIGFTSTPTYANGVLTLTTG